LFVCLFVCLFVLITSVQIKQLMQHNLPYSLL
jgi:hypothetical protein